MKILAILFLTASALSAQTPAPRLVMVSVDGLMPRTLRNAEKLGIRLPNLTEFRDGGAMAQGLLGVFPTVTYPSHTTMVTGLAPAEHGIVSNTMFDPERVLNGAWFWYSELIKVPTLWDAAREAGLRTAAVGWPVTAGALIDYNFPEYRAFRNDDDRLLFRSLPTPGLLADYEKSRGTLELYGEHMDDMLSGLAAFVLETRKPHLMLVHLIDLDHDQHLHGPESREALQTLEKIDAAIGRLRNAVTKAGVDRETNWIVVSDHGFFSVGKMFHPEAMLASLGLSAGADPKSWRVATMTAGGSAAFILKDPNDQEARSLVLKMLKSLASEDRFGIDRIIERNELARMKSWPDAFVAVSMSEGWTMGSNRSGPWVTVSERTKGTHGYAPGPEALDCTFVAFGPNVKKQQLPRSNLLDVAPTAAQLLKVALPGAADRNLLQSGPEARQSQ